MNNFERISKDNFSEISKVIKENKDKECLILTLNKRRNPDFICNGSTTSGCNNCYIEQLRWLSKDCKSRFLLSKMEKDLLKTVNADSRFFECGTLTDMKKLGYFKEIEDQEMTIAEILANSNVQEVK